MTAGVPDALEAVRTAPRAVAVPQIEGPAPAPVAPAAAPTAAEPAEAAVPEEAASPNLA
jgi:hypothetical protein